MSKGACHCVYGDASSECQKHIFTTHVKLNLTVVILRDDMYVSRQPLRVETYECVLRMCITQRVVSEVVLDYITDGRAL